MVRARQRSGQSAAVIRAASCFPEPFGSYGATRCRPHRRHELDREPEVMNTVSTINFNSPIEP
jgi:hypothetical protein